MITETMLEDMEVTSSATQTEAGFAANGTPAEDYSWISENTNGQGWVQLDFKEKYQISRYVIRHAEAGGAAPELNNRNFNIEISPDGRTWTTVGTHIDNTLPVTDATITPMMARYLRVRVTKGGSDGRVRIGDIEVYGAKQ